MFIKSPTFTLRSYAKDIYPFGSLIPNRHGSSGSYRYGFQGQEKDDELKGEGNSLNYTFRMHDPRIGRFFAPDPLEAKYPWYTPYQFSGNRVMAFVELEGLEEATPKQKQNALQAIKNFENKTDTESSWSNISKQDFAKSLYNMVNNPESIDQSNTNLCGIAASSKASIEYNPEGFVNMSLGLYQYGKYGDVKANSDLLENKPTNGLNEAEYIVMTSLRNSLNAPGHNYDPATDKGPSGFTWPSDIGKILEGKMGLESTMTLPKISQEQLKNQIGKALNAKNFVLALVNTDHFMGKTSWSMIPDHYIQITGIKALTGEKSGMYQINWWSWGENQKPLEMSAGNLFNSIYTIGAYE